MLLSEPEHRERPSIMDCVSKTMCWKNYEMYLSRKITEKCHPHILLKNPTLVYPDQKIIFEI